MNRLGAFTINGNRIENPAEKSNSKDSNFQGFLQKKLHRFFLLLHKKVTEKKR